MHVLDADDSGVSGQLDRQSHATTLAAPGDDRPSVFCGHARTEAQLALARLALRLPGPFHRRSDRCYISRVSIGMAEGSSNAARNGGAGAPPNGGAGVD